MSSPHRFLLAIHNHVSHVFSTTIAVCRPWIVAVLCLCIAGCLSHGDEERFGDDIPLVPLEDAYRYVGPELSSASDLAFDSDGGVYVADIAGSRILQFTRQLDFHQAIGRRGQGPGEFVAPVSVQVLGGDSLLIYDVAQSRITILDSGHYPRRTLAPGAGVLLRTAYALGDQLVGLSRNAHSYNQSSSSAAVIRFDETGSSDKVMSLPPDHSMEVPSDDGVFVAQHPFRGQNMVRASNNRLFHAHGDRINVSAVDVDGSSRAIVDVDYVAPRVTDADVVAYVETIDPLVSASVQRWLSEHRPDRWAPVTGFAVSNESEIYLVVRMADGNVLLRFTSEGHPTSKSLWPDHARLLGADRDLVYTFHPYSGERGSPALIAYRLSVP
jgi:hypothetical protein